MVYKFYLIRTPHTIDWIETQLYEFNYGQSVLKVIRDKNGQETNRTIAFLDEVVADKVMSQKRVDWRMEEFVVPPWYLPDPARYTSNFCIPFPENWKQQFDPTDKSHPRDEFYFNQIREKLRPFILQRLIPSDGFTIHTPIISREKSQTNPIAFVVFNPSIAIETLAVIRYVLDQSSWQDLSPFRCYWAVVSKRYRQK
jgi:hypothetical protein